MDYLVLYKIFNESHYLPKGKINITIPPNEIVSLVIEILKLQSAEKIINQQTNYSLIKNNTYVFNIENKHFDSEICRGDVFNVISSSDNDDDYKIELRAYSEVYLSELLERWGIEEYEDIILKPWCELIPKLTCKITQIREVNKSESRRGGEFYKQINQFSVPAEMTLGDFKTLLLENLHLIYLSGNSSNLVIKENHQPLIYNDSITLYEVMSKEFEVFYLEHLGEIVAYINLDVSGRNYLGEKSIPRNEYAKNAVKKNSLPASTKKGMIYRLWYGTNRKLISQNNISLGYSSERDNTIHVGQCRVFVPKSHKIGSLGSPFWRRWITLKDDRLKLEKINELSAAAYLKSLNKCLGNKNPENRLGIIFIHGFNVSFEEAALRAAQLGCDLGIDGVMAFYSWPSKGNVKDYIADEASIEGSEDYLAQFLTMFATQTSIKNLHIIAHSMGNRGLLRALQKIIYTAQNATNIKFGQIFLAAPDIDTNLFVKLANVYNQVSERTTLYISERDRALKASGIIHKWPRVGYSPPITIIEGIDTVEVTDIDLTFLGHGYIAELRDIIHDMHEAIFYNAPPEKRMGLYGVHRSENEIYWKING